MLLKHQNLRTALAAAGVATIVITTTASTSSAGLIVLTVDVTDPSAVVIESTGATSLINNDSTDDLEGVSLVDLFTSDYEPVFDAPSDTFGGTLAARNGSAFEDLENPKRGSSFFAPFDLRSLNLYHFDDPDRTQKFRTDEAAFSGTATIDLSGAQFDIGMIGDVIAGDNSKKSSRIVGHYEIITTPIPEPVALLGGTSLCGLIALRRRRGEATSTVPA
jgi:hypothetical protein